VRTPALPLAAALAASCAAPSGPGMTAEPVADAPVTPTSVDGGQHDTGSEGSEPGSADPCAADAVDPGAPAPPAVIGTLTVTVSTRTNATNGTRDPTLALCLTAERCFALTQSNAPQTDAGATGVWMFEDVGLPRAEVDRVELRVTDGADQWRPARLDLRFDGEPVHCADLDVPIGTDPGDLPVWADPSGLHQGCGSAWEDRALTHGPMVGAVGPDWANLWVRTDATRPVSVQVWPSTDPTAARIAAWAHPLAADDFTATLRAECLAPATAYTYQVWVDGAPQGQPGAFTTAPPDGEPGLWTMAFGSCTPSRTRQPAFGAIAREGVDWFAFVGDNHYANTTDLDAVRWFYRMSLEHFERAALAAVTPTFAVWDDHDYTGNDTDGNVPGKERSLRAFTEYWANPGYGLPEAAGVYFAHAWGDVDLVFLDNRYWRGVEGSMLGTVQHEWLVERLTTSTARFKLLIDGSQWSFDGTGDSWDDFRADRDALFELITEQGIPGVVLLSGDIHRSELREILGASYPIPEISSSPLAHDNPGTCHEGVETELITCLDQANYYVTVDVDTIAADPSLTATIHLEDGTAVFAHAWTLSALSPP
jgi:alkaline phosphatase D